MIINIGSTGQFDTMLRAECEDAKVDTVIKAVRAMLKDKKAHTIGKQYSPWLNAPRGRRGAPLIRDDEIPAKAIPGT